MGDIFTFIFLASSFAIVFEFLIWLGSGRKTMIGKFDDWVFNGLKIDDNIFKKYGDNFDDKN